MSGTDGAGPARVVVVEAGPDAARALARVLEADGDVSVVATAFDRVTALEHVRRLRPDVVTLDLGLPAGGGPATLDAIMREVPTPILVVSGTFSEPGAPDAVAALAAGAVEALPKPTTWDAGTASDLRRMVRRVRGVPVIGRRGRARPATAAPRRPAALERPAAAGTSAVVGIAASTGGPAAVSTVLRGLAACPAPVLVVQHIHPSFADGFADWLSTSARRPVTVPADGERLQAGRAYVAPADRHLRLGPRRTAALAREPALLHRPSADVLFESLAQEAGAQAIGVVLTGMGADGSRGLAALHAAGGQVLAQDEASSVVFGMPQAAVRGGVVDEVVALDDMAASIRAALRRVRR